MSFPVNERLTEGLTFIPVLAVASPSTTKQNGTKVDLSKVRKTATVFSVGTISASETITCQYEGSVNGTSGWTVLTGTSATIVTAQGSNSAVVIETNAENLNAYNSANGTTFKFVRPTATCAVGSPITLAQVGGAGPEEPISGQNPTTVLGTYVF